MGIHKTRPKILPFVNIRNENELPCVCVLSVTVCLPFGAIYKPFWRVLVDFRFRVVLSIRNN